MKYFLRMQPKMMMLYVSVLMSCQSTASRTGAPRPGEGVSKEAFAAKLSEIDACQGVDQRIKDDFYSRLDQCDDFVHSPVETEISTTETPVESGFALGKQGGLPSLISGCYKAVCGWFKKTPEPKKVEASGSPNSPDVPERPDHAPKSTDDVNTVKPSSELELSEKQVEEIFKQDKNALIPILDDLIIKSKAGKEKNYKECKKPPEGCEIHSQDLNCSRDRQVDPIVCARKMNRAISCGVRVMRRVASGNCTHIRMENEILPYMVLMLGYAADYRSCSRLCAGFLPGRN